MSREGCHLCAEMHDVVRAVAQEVGVPGPEVLDLDRALADGRLDAQRHTRWNTLVPVLLVDGEEVAALRAAPEEVCAALRRAVRRRRGPGWFRRFGGSGGASLE